MNKEIEVKFLQWLSTKEEFANMSPEQISKKLDQLSKSGEKGKAIIQNLVTEFTDFLKSESASTEQSAMMKKGGKIDQLVNKYQKGTARTRLGIDDPNMRIYPFNLSDYDIQEIERARLQSRVGITTPFDSPYRDLTKFNLSLSPSDLDIEGMIRLRDASSINKANEIISRLYQENSDWKSAYGHMANKDLEKRVGAIGPMSQHSKDVMDYVNSIKSSDVQMNRKRPSSYYDLLFNLYSHPFYQYKIDAFKKRSQQ